MRKTWEVQIERFNPITGDIIQDEKCFGSKDEALDYFEDYSGAHIKDKFHAYLTEITENEDGSCFVSDGEPLNRYSGR